MENLNGSIKSSSGMNGTNGSPHTNGYANGSAHVKKPLANGHAVGSRRKQAAPSPGMVAWAFSMVARLLTWYSIITILFRCPSTLQECDHSSPRICRPYFQVKHAVSPHLTPYYETYAAPYVQLVQPYYETLDRNVITPGWGYANKHATPRLAQAQAYTQAQWNKNVQPQLLTYQTLAKEKYDDTLAPHVARAADAMAPYVDIARTNALQTYHEILLPTYETAAPYAQQGYAIASAFTTETAVPSALWAWDRVYVFLDGTVWPHLRVVYSQSVEPQLVKIGQRLGRHNEKGMMNNKTVPESISSTAAKLAPSFTKPTSAAASNVLTSAVVDPTPEPQPEPEFEQKLIQEVDNAEPPEAPEAPSEPIVTETAQPESEAEEDPSDDADWGQSEDIKKARKIVAEDLRGWQERYAKAADEGAAEIDDRVEEITKRMLRRQAKTTGKGLVQQLRKSSDGGIASLKKNIIAIVSAVKRGKTTSAEAQEQVATAVRGTGTEIKTKAQEVRTWRENYEMEMHGAITKAAESHFEILASIRDLALQKIGMKWAWMEGVTYKDWRKYHELKDRFDEWQADLERLIVTHPSLEVAQAEGVVLEDEAMEIAQGAAKELARIKQVAAWKLTAQDDSDDFDSTMTKLAAEAASAAKVADDKFQEAVSSVAEGAKSAATMAQDMAGSISDHIMPSNDKEAVLAPTTSVAAAQEVSAVSGTSEETSNPLESIIESATSHSDGAVSEATGNPIESIIDSATFHSDGATSEATSNPLEAIVESATEAPSDAISDAAAQATTLVLEETPGENMEAEQPVTSSVKPALFGAAAQKVPNRQVILDDDDDSIFGGAADAMESLRSNLPATFSSMANSAYSAAVSQANLQYSQALSIVSVQIKGTPKPVHEQMLASVTSAYSNAVASASSRLDDALKALQDKMPTPTKPTAAFSMPTMPNLPTLDWERVELLAAARLSQGRDWAEQQYESAKIAIGLATPTPSTAPEHVQKMLENARHNYYAGVGVAHARFDEFLSAASSAMRSLTATPTPTDVAGTITSIASGASETAASIASVVGENVSAAAQAGYDSAAAAAQAGYDSAAAAAQAGYDSAGSAGAYLQDSFDSIVSQLSTQIYGAPTPTPWYQQAQIAASEGASAVTSAASAYATAAGEQAGKQYEAVSSLISELMVGKEPDFTESVYLRLSGAYATGVASAESLLSAASQTVVSVASEATEAVKSSVKYAKDEL